MYLAEQPKHQLTLADIENEILIQPEDMYNRKLMEVENEASISLDDAMTCTMDTQLMGACPSDILPTMPKRAMDTGLLPPISDSELGFSRVMNRQAEGLEKYKMLLVTNKMTLADTKGYRIRTAYRLIRRMARIRGLLSGWDRLQACMASLQTEDGLSAWYVPMRLEQASFVTGYRGIRNLLNIVDASNNFYTFNTARGLRTFRGSTTLPPPLPDSAYPTREPEEIWKWRVSGRVPANYHPKDDHNLCLFCEAMSLLSYQMCIDDGSKEEPWAGVYGTAGLFNPGTARQAWPTRDELILYEEELLLHVFDKLSNKSSYAANQDLIHNFGFDRFEAVDIVKTATEAGGILYQENAENQRAIILKQLDTIADDCKDAMDPRARLATIKMKAQILGLTQSTENESMAVLRDAAVNALRPPEEEDFE